MTKGYGLHIGLSRVDPTAHPTSFPFAEAVRVAREMRQISHELGYERARLLADHRATLGAFRAAFTAIATALEDGDLFLLTFAGHGFQHVDTGVPDEPRDQALILYDDILIDDELHAMLAAIPVRARVVVVVEACFSGSIVNFPDRRLLRATSAGVAADGLSRNGPLDLGRLVTRAGNGGGPSPAVTANVLLLAATTDMDVAREVGRDITLPPFTQALLDSWEMAPSYLDLHRLMTSRTLELGAFTAPVLNEELVNDRQLLLERPFSIGDARPRRGSTKLGQPVEST